MEYKFEIVKKTESASLRAEFVKHFVDTESAWYQKYIAPVDPSEVKVYTEPGKCYVQYFMRDCLRPGKNNVVSFSDGMKILSDKSPEWYVMFNLCPRGAAYLNDFKSFKPAKETPPYHIFQSDVMLRMKAKELTRMIEDDRLGSYEDMLLGEDFYAFTPDMFLHVAFTHEDIGDAWNVCYTNAEGFEVLWVHERVYSFSQNNRTELENDSLCGCFHCCRIFKPKEIKRWIIHQGTDDFPNTALCPYCGVDSVIGKYTNYPITLEFLHAMNKRQFI